GSPYSEAVSWGKFVPPAEGGKFGEVFVDATVGLPLIVAAGVGRLGKKNSKTSKGKKGAGRRESERLQIAFHHPKGPPTSPDFAMTSSLGPCRTNRCRPSRRSTLPRRSPSSTAPACRLPPTA